MKRFSLTILLFLPLLSIAQSNYKKGYAVNIKGDTLRGYIDFKEWGHNPKSVNFKIALADKARQLGTPNIKYFEIEGYVSYRKYPVAISLNPVDISAPSSSADTASVTDTVFLKILQTGKNVTLYSYSDGIKERFYIKDDTMIAPTELLYGIYQGSSSDNVITKSTYQLQLNQLVMKYKPDDDKLIKEVQQSPYKEDDLIAAAAQINGNTQAQASLKSGNNSAIRFFAGAAFISSSIKAGQYYGNPTSTSGSPKIALGIDLMPNPNIGHLIFRVELAYATNSYSFLSIPDPLENNTAAYTSSIKVKQNVVFVTPQVIYNIYNADMLKIFVDAGYSINFLSYPTNQVTSFQYGKPGAVQSYEALSSKSNYATFQFKAGVVLNKRFEIYGAYFPVASLTYSLYADATNNLTSYQVGINYFLGKVAH